MSDALSRLSNWVEGASVTIGYNPSSMQFFLDVRDVIRRVIAAEKVCDQMVADWLAGERAIEEMNHVLRMRQLDNL